ncbi:ricin-type beta-trefoil lectin domain protein [Bacterioplanoides sp.]|uniref:ricin-type beta-trefoil lectin domain protein n=1 Tax=Bacterioplanoides sp. TaxID=2066072 RepID=UPI003B5A1141
MKKITTAAAFSSLLIASQAFSLSAVPTAENDNTAMAQHQQTWAYQAYQKQDLLDNAAPIAQGYNSSSHNAFNSSAYGSIYIDPNHSLSIVEQLDIGVRALELDVHWTHQMKDIPHGDALLLCHFGGQRGCSALERYFSDAVAEVNDWLRKNPRAVVYMGFEDYWANNEDKMLEALAPIDDLIYKPGTCTDFLEAAKTLTEEDVLKAGKQVLLLNGDCATGDWAAAAYKGGWGYTSIAASQADNCLTANASWNGGGVQRIFEQQTFFGTTFGNDNGLYSDDQIRKAQKCGVNQVSYDKLVINDSGMKASIWSWAENYPSASDAVYDCAYHGPDGLFRDSNCSDDGHYACKTADGKQWTVSNSAGSENSPSAGQAACQATGSQWHFAVPTNSMQNELLKIAKAATGHENIWLNYSDKANEGIWLTPEHEVDYRDGIADVSKILPGKTYEFFMKSVVGSCELEWNGGYTGSADRNAKFDCASKGDPLLFVPIEKPTTTGGKASVRGYIKAEAQGYLCGLEWASSLDNNERNAKWDCSGGADPVTIISDSEGTTANVRITTDNNCGLQWAGGDAENNERNAKFDCDPAWDAMRLYGMSTVGVKMTRAIQNTYGCDSGDARCDKFLEFSGHDVKVAATDVKWEFISVEGTTDQYYIRSTYGCNNGNARCYDWLTFSGTDVIIDGADKVAWKLTPIEGKNDTFYIQSRYGCETGDERCDDYLTFSGTSGKIHATDPVEWRLVKPDTYVEIRNAGTGKCLDFEGSDPSNGAKAIVWDCTDVAWQKWKFDPETGLLRNKANPDYCLDHGSNLGNGGLVHMWACVSSSDNQKWDVAGNSLRPRNGTSFVLDAFGSDNGAQAGLWSHHSGSNQQWLLGH